MKFARWYGVNLKNKPVFCKCNKENGFVFFNFARLLALPRLG